LSISIQERIRAFLVKSKGCFSTIDIEELRSLLATRDILLNQSDILELVRKEKISIEEKSNVLFMCKSGPCRRTRRFSENQEWIKNHNPHVEVEETICQWGCEQAPIATLYKNSEWTRYDNFNAKDILNAAE
jgi:hypothetical protein